MNYEVMVQEYIHHEFIRAQQELEAIKDGSINWAYPAAKNNSVNNVGHYFNEKLVPCSKLVIDRYLAECLRLTKIGEPFKTTIQFRQVELRELLKKVFGELDEGLANEDNRDSAVKYYMRHADERKITKSEEYGYYNYGGDGVILNYDHMLNVLQQAVKSIQLAELGQIYTDVEKNRRLIADSNYAINELNKMIKIFEGTIADFR